MRWILFALSVGTLLAASSAVSHAEDDPRLEKILDHWEKLPEDLQSCRLSGRRYVYDSVFQVERRADFEIGWEKDGRAIIRFKPVDIPEGEQSQRLTSRGKAYTLQTDVEETWYSPNRRELIQVKHNGIERCALRIEIPASQQSDQGGLWWSWDAVRAWIQFLTEFPVHPALVDFTFQLDWEIVKEDEGYYWLRGVAPEKSRPSRNFKQLELILNKSDLSIVAMKFLDPAGTTETVYCFSERKVNPLLHFDFDIHEEQLKFIEPFHNQQLTEPLRAPKPTNGYPSASQSLARFYITRMLLPWLP